MSFQAQWAALLYYEAKGSKVPFEQVEDVEQRKYLTRVTKHIEQLQKLNLMIVPAQSVESAEAEHRARVTRVRCAVQQVVDQITLWKKDAFPTDEVVLQAVHAVEQQ
jgi:hypothetical protein